MTVRVQFSAKQSVTITKENGSAGTLVTITANEGEYQLRFYDLYSGAFSYFQADDVETFIVQLFALVRAAKAMNETVLDPDGSLQAIFKP